MNAGASTASRVPGGFWHRYAAWSLDFVAIAAIAWFATRAQVHAGIDAALAGWRQLFAQASQAMSDALLSGRSVSEIKPPPVCDRDDIKSKAAKADRFDRVLYQIGNSVILPKVVRIECASGQ